MRQVEAERVICLTATATTAVVEGIREAFDIDGENVYRQSPYRPKYVTNCSCTRWQIWLIFNHNSLWLNIEYTDQYEDKIVKTLDYVQANSGSTVIYATFVSVR